ncbi:hypothetical protein [Thalassospira lucentensis]|uniref:hypothetical protein n=1 Tax=Thalassospira lucentensis TaxID=168935 RepID=UPI00142E0B8D|nr:hypothetical protein [Thalassospira lucentensis]NIZ00361.1 hypothetical protein [Thalassospira lucentensis]
MAKSHDQDKGPSTGSFMNGPKPAAPFPKYEPGTDPVLTDRLPTSSAITSAPPAGVPDSLPESDSFTVAGIEGRIDRNKAHVAGKLVDTDPDQALRVIRNWLLKE